MDCRARGASGGAALGRSDGVKRLLLIAATVVTGYVLVAIFSLYVMASGEDPERRL